MVVGRVVGKLDGINVVGETVGMSVEMVGVVVGRNDGVIVVELEVGSREMVGAAEDGFFVGMNEVGRRVGENDVGVVGKLLDTLIVGWEDGEWVNFIVGRGLPRSHRVKLFTT